MNRRGLWAGGLALILLVVVGAAALLTTVGAGYAKNEDAASKAKCSEATLKGTYLFAQNGVEIKGNDQRPFAIAGYDVFDGNGKVRGASSGNFNGEVFRNDRFSGTYSVKANCTGTVTFKDGRLLRRATCSSPLMALSSRSCVPTPSLCRRGLTRR